MIRIKLRDIVIIVVGSELLGSAIKWYFHPNWTLIQILESATFTAAGCVSGYLIGQVLNRKTTQR
jgi:hypothetical protein